MNQFTPKKATVKHADWFLPVLTGANFYGLGPFSGITNRELSKSDTAPSLLHVPQVLIHFGDRAAEHKPQNFRAGWELLQDEGFRDQCRIYARI